jgi:hypothetical protein
MLHLRTGEHMSKPEPQRKRKPAARRTELVIAAMEERLTMMITHEEQESDVHVTRVFDLLDELKRSLGKRDEPETE